VPDPITPNFIADRINANRQFQDEGIVARSDGTTVTVLSLTGDDLSFEISGDYNDGLSVGTGTDIALRPTGATPFQTLSEFRGYDFSVGGPFIYEFDVPGQGTFEIELTDNFADGNALLAGITTALDNSGVVLPGNLDVEINELGEISFQARLPVTATGPNGSSKFTIGGEVKVVLDEGYSLDVAPPGNNLFPANPVGEPIHFGFNANITGLVQEGDEFTFEFNSDGRSDSRNGVVLSDLQITNVISDNTSFSESYSRLVEGVGSITSRAQINRDSAEILLRNSEDAVLSISAVNLDEEAARLIQFELAYNASAQVIQVAQQIFDTLIGTFR